MPRSRTSRFKHDRIVFATLKREARPLSAHQVMERLRQRGVSSPVVVYRALRRLIGEGKVHRIESLNAYVAAIDSKTEFASPFAVCCNCGKTEQVYDRAVAQQFRTWAQDHSFKVEQVSFEARGRCNACICGTNGALECRA